MRVCYPLLTDFDARQLARWLWQRSNHLFSFLDGHELSLRDSLTCLALILDASLAIVAADLVRKLPIVFVVHGSNGRRWHPPELVGALQLGYRLDVEVDHLLKFLFF